MSSDTFSLSTISLKVSFLAFIVVFALHVTGFSLPRWSSSKRTIDLDITESEDFGDINYDIYAGLWKRCICATIPSFRHCECNLKQQNSGSFTAVQALETIGLIGLITSGFLTCVVLFTKQDQTIRVINIGIAIGSGVFIVIGVIVYAVKGSDDYDSFLARYVEDFEDKYGLDTAKLSTSFILCTIAGSLCIIGFATLLLVDLCTAEATGHAQQQLQTLPVQNQYRTYTVTSQATMSTGVQQQSHYPSPPAYAPPFQTEQQYPPGNNFNKI